MQASSGSADVADRTWPKARRSCLELAVTPSAVGIARHWTADQLAAPGPGRRAAADPDLIDSAMLVVSELVTNAIQAVAQSAPASSLAVGPVMLTGRILSFADLAPAPGRTADLAGSAAAAAAAGALIPGSALAAPPRVCLVVTRFPNLVRIEVHDSSDVPLPPTSPGSSDDESGRGLTVVAALARKWGWQPARAGKVVWCELTC